LPEWHILIKIVINQTWRISFTVENLPKDLKISKDEMKKVIGGSINAGDLGGSKISLPDDFDLET